MQAVTYPAKSHADTIANWIGWLPLVILPMGTITLREKLPAWVFMWAMAMAIFAGFKWWIWWSAISKGIKTTAWRSIAFLFFWPGMDGVPFLDGNRTVAKPSLGLWALAFTKMVFGAFLIWEVARLAGHGLLAGWIGMIGLIFILHFGAFHLLALFWQQNGIDAQPLMHWPVCASSLSDFWSKRWNSGFRDLAFGLLFRRLAGQLSPRIATLMVFFISGLIHELVITLPAGADYGLPTLYFTIQGSGLLFERTRLAKQLGLHRTVRGRIFTIAVVTLPVFALFPEPFVVRVMVPFFQFIKALP